MTFRQEEQQLSQENGNSDDVKTKNDNKKVIRRTKDGAPYVICKSKEPFVNPTITPGTTLEERIQKLNLDLGQTLITRKRKLLLWTIKLLDGICFAWWETLYHKVWRAVPLRYKRALVWKGWPLYLKFHKMMLGRRTGLHPSQSDEYHALTSILWGSRLFPVTPRRVRFSLSELHVCTPNVVKARVETIEEEQQQVLQQVPKQQKEHCTVRGLYLHQIHDSPSEKVIFWLYGGAFFGGDPLGNSSVADYIATQSGGMDVFLPEFRLAPEANLDDILWDVCLAYRWLLNSREIDPSNITLVGVSSGAGLCVSLMQLIVEHARGEELLPSYLGDVIKDCQMPKCAAFFGPYVDYSIEKTGSFLHNPRMDLIVNESVQVMGLSYLKNFIPDGKNQEYAPLKRSMCGLPPLCIVVSEHEAVYDMTIELVNKARADGVSVTVGVWKYMCHVFTLLWGFIPEGQLSMDFVCDWIMETSSCSK